ncbi:hypothetical protein HDK77DRAFT_60483 [Phyllosticta capitalensis]|uniref:Uncharacterized protein n=2 Tax=Phyllosticta capitalensis TaxID=121624 RepID=A0ABR1Y8Y5_9PEZI
MPPRYQIVPHHHHHHRRDVIVRCGSRRELVEARTIRAYLPDAFLSIRQDDCLDLDQYIAGCPATAAGLITSSSMLRVCEELLDILGYNPGDGQEAQLALSDLLARAVIADRRRGRSHGETRFPESIAIFMTLADMSREFGSRRLASVCHGFFLSHGHRIVQAERSRAIILWSWAIMMSKMSEAEQIECLREIARVRPDMALSSRYDDYLSIPGMKEVKTSFLRIVQYENGRAIERRHRHDAEDSGLLLLDRRERHLGHRRRPAQATVQRHARVLDSWPVEHNHHHLVVRDAGVPRALRDIAGEQRQLRHDMRHVRHDLEDINYKVDKLAWDDARRREWEHFPDGWPDVDEYEWFEESWDDYY